VLLLLLGMLEPSGSRGRCIGCDLLCVFVVVLVPWHLPLPDGYRSSSFLLLVGHRLGMA
jgi:hypothetical protein